MTIKDNIISARTPAEMGLLAARQFGLGLKQAAEGGQKNPVVVLPTGLTPLPFYEELVTRFKQGADSLNLFTYIQLDEYLGLPPADKRLFSKWIGNTCLDPLKVPADRRLIFKSDTSSPDSECQKMEDTVRERGGIDIAVLGIGLNGHIGFNEPGSSFDSQTRAVDLAPETVNSHKDYWDTHPPSRGMTLGIDTLKTAQRTLLLVSGVHKAKILKSALTGPVTPDVPASYLQEQPHTTIIADKDALSALAV